MWYGTSYFSRQFLKAQRKVGTPRGRRTCTLSSECHPAARVKSLNLCTLYIPTIRLSVHQVPFLVRSSCHPPLSRGQGQSRLLSYLPASSSRVWPHLVVARGTFAHDGPLSSWDCASCCSRTPVLCHVPGYGVGEATIGGQALLGPVSHLRHSSPAASYVGDDPRRAGRGNRERPTYCLTVRACLGWSIPTSLRYS